MTFSILVTKVAGILLFIHVLKVAFITEPVMAYIKLLEVFEMKNEKKPKEPKFSSKRQRQMEVESISNELKQLDAKISDEVNHFHEIESSGSEVQLESVTSLIKCLCEERSRLYERLDSLTAKDNSALCMRIRVIGSVIATAVSIILSAFIEDVLGKLIKKQRPIEKI